MTVRRLASAAIAVAALAGPAGCAVAPTPSDDDAALRALVAQADAWDKAIVRKDKAAIEANVGQRFFHIGGDGSVESREEFLAGLLDPQLVIDPYEVRDLRVMRFGDTVLLSGVTRMTGTYAGKPFVSHYRYIDTYAKEGDRWVVVALQITKIAQAVAGP